MPHRDRLVILSFATSPYQNNSVHEENYGKQHQQQNRRPLFGEDDDELAHTHLIEKFHSGTFDENDYFDTHEKLENERTTLLMITSPPVTAPSNNYNIGNGNGYNSRGMYFDANKSVKTTTAPTPSISTNTESNEKQQLNMENPATHTNANGNNNNSSGNRRQRVRNRNNGGMAGGRGSNRKNSNGNRERFNDNVAAATTATAANRREKYNRRVDDLRENIETKVNNNLEFEMGGGGSSAEFGGKGAADTKPQRKYITKIDTADELPPNNEFELNAGNRKSSTVRDSNIHIVKPADTNSFVPSTPYSTDSKIIEIKPSTVRTSKRTKRSNEIINTRLEIDSEGMEDEFGDLVDEDIAKPKFSVNFENDEQYEENEESSLKPEAAAAAAATAIKSVPDAVAAALIDNTVVPANVTPITTTSTTSKQLNGFVGCLQHYLKVDKEIGKRNIFRMAQMNVNVYVACNKTNLRIYHWYNNINHEKINVFFLLGKNVWRGGKRKRAHIHKYLYIFRINL